MAEGGSGSEKPVDETLSLILDWKCRTGNMFQVKTLEGRVGLHTPEEIVSFSLRKESNDSGNGFGS